MKRRMEGLPSFSIAVTFASHSQDRFGERSLPLLMAASQARGTETAINETTMSPIDPVRAVPESPNSPMAPPWGDENVNLDLVREGLEAADDELRDAVSDEYEEDALEEDDVSESLDDIDRDDDESDGSPEVGAMHLSRGEEDIESTDP